MGKDGGGSLGAYESVEYRKEKMAVITRTPDEIVVVMIRDNVQYEESEWVGFFTEQPLAAVNRVLKTLNNKSYELHREASEFYYDRIHKENFDKNFEDTAPGKRYFKFLREHGFLTKGQKYVSTSCAITAYAVTVKRRG